MKTLLITGAEGFTGWRLTQHLEQRGYDVIGGVRNRARKLAFERRHGKALVCDVSDAINVARVVASAKPDGIIHLAGQSRPYAAAEEPLTAYQSIVSAWANVLDAARRIVPRCHVVLASACDVYGDTANSGQQLKETDATNPSTTFGALKSAAEQIAETFFNNYHLNITIARPFHYTGPNQSDAFFLGNVARMLATWDISEQGTNIQLPDLDCERDMMHVQDVVEAYTRLLEDGKPNQVYNICSGKTVRVGEMVRHLIRLSGKPLTVSELSTGEENQTKKLWGDNTKIRSELSWNPTRTVEQALLDLYKGHQAEAAATAR